LIEQNIKRLVKINTSLEHRLKKYGTEIKRFPRQSILKQINQINQIRYDKLVTELTEETNLFQITDDRGKVKEKIKEFGFSPTLNKALNKVEDYYWNTGSDEFDYSSAIKLLRQFHEKLIKEICSKIKEKTNDDYPTDMKTLIANLRKYMKEHLQLKKENKLINGLVDLINNKGPHALTSEKEYFRLTKNMTIEVALLLLSKLERFLHFY